MGHVNLRKLRVGISIFSILFIIGISYTNCGRSFEVQDFAPLAQQSIDQLSTAQLSIISQPSAIHTGSEAQIEFDFNSSGPGVELKCYQNSVEIQNCQSPLVLNNLQDGDYNILFVAQANGNMGSVSNNLSEASVQFKVDRTPPTINVTAPSSVVTTNMIAISFVVSDSGSGIESTQCSLDSGAFSDCVSPKSLTNLSNGVHQFVVKAKDRAGHETTSQPVTFTVNTSGDMPPQLAWVQNPITLTKNSTASFSFSASGAAPIQKTECRLDNSAYENCSSPKSYSGLSEGQHTIMVRVTDSNGQTNTLSHTWTVDMTPPSKPQLSANEMSPTNKTNLNITFSSNDASGINQYLCRQNSGAAAPCTSPKAYANLTEGTHTFYVKAEDKAGNTSEEASIQVTVDLKAPVITLTQNPNTITNQAQASFQFTVSDGNGSGIASITCQWNQNAATSCTNSANYTVAQAGVEQTFTVKATDKVGNSSTVVYKWTYSPNSGPQPEPGGPLAAFSGAQGGGAAAVGGRGGKVIEVTNLNDSGTGSLRACATASGPRICVFRVGGIINLKSQILISNPYLTIAGQTAPGGGILIRGSTMSNGNRSSILVRTHNVVIRYVRMRFGANTQGSEGGINFEVWGNSGQNISNIILDHVSLSWGTDENASFWSQGAHFKNITVSYSLIAEGLKKYASKGLIIGSHVADARNNMRDIDVHHNLIMHNMARNPYVGVKEQSIINNLIYNWGNETGIAMRGGLSVDIIGNVMKPGLDSDHGSNPDDMSWYPYDSSGCNRSEYCIEGNPSIYVQGNVVYPNDKRSNPDNDNWPHVQGWTSTQGNFSLPTSYRRTTPLSSSRPLAHPIKIHHVDKDNLENHLLAEVGASHRLDCDGSWVPNRDSVDTRLVNDYKNGTGRIPSTENNVGGFPNIASGTPCADTDKDGMPDVWEAKYGFDPNNPADGNQDADGDGYTNIEEYLNGTNPKI